MKNKFIKIGVVLAVTLLAVATVGMTTAMLKASTDEVVNTFEVGSVTTEIVEEGGDASTKSPKIVNVGENACLVRVRVTMSPTKAQEVVAYDGKDITNWTWKDDGFAYYEKPLKPGEATEPLFTGLKLIEDNMTEEKWLELGMDNFEVTVYQEAVQTVVYVNGNEITDEDAIWKIYESESTQSSGQN